MGYDGILGALEDAGEALGTADREALDDALDRLLAEYETVKVAERSNVARLQVARTESTLSPEQQETLGDYQRWFMTANFGRGAFLGGSDLYLLDPAEADPTELADRASALSSRERSLRDATDQTTDVLEGVVLPPRLGVLSLATAPGSPAFGDEVRASVLIGNVGDEVAKDVSIRLESDALDLDDTHDVGSIPPRDRRDSSFGFIASAGGSMELTVTVDSENAGRVSESTTLFVRTKRSMVETIIATLSDLPERVSEAAPGKGEERSVNSKLEAAIRSLNRSLTFIEKGQRRQADNAIRAAITELRALINHLAAGGGARGNALPTDLRTALTNHAETAIETLDEARETELAS